jgi:hypothetical protein
MQYSPKLKKAMEEMKAIIKKYDIAALIVLHSPGNSEYLNAITPSYSCMKWNGDELRIRAKLKEDFNGDKKSMEEKLAATSNMLRLLSEVGGQQLLSIMKVSDFVDELLGSKHTDGDHTSHTEQNQ